MVGFFDLVRAEFYSYTRFYKNNRQLLLFSFVWPYLMTMMLMGLGYLFGSPAAYARRMGVESAALYVLAASVVAMSAVYILDDVAGYALYNRWNGTLPYIALAPAPLYMQLLAASIPSTVISPAVAVTSIAPAMVYMEGARGLLTAAALYALILAGMLPLAGMAVLAASALLMVREESNILSSVSAFMLFVSGLFYPPTILPKLLAAISKAVPVTYVVEGARLLAGATPMLGGGVYGVAYVLALLALAYNGVAFAVIPSAERRVRRVGLA